MVQALVFLLILSAAILIHELGHFISARIFGIKVEEFGFGLPPRLVRLFRRGETEYTVNWLPIGGFVKLMGEDGVGEELVDNRSFAAKPIWQRGIVLTAGVVMNFLMGVALFGAVYSYLGVPTKIGGVKILEVVADSPAQTAGLQSGQIVVQAGETPIEEIEAFIKIVNEHKGRKLFLTLDNEQEVVVVPNLEIKEGEGALGVVITDMELRQFPWWQMPFRGMWVGLQEAVGWGKEIVVGLGRFLVKVATGKAVGEEVPTGPIGIYQLTDRVRQQGILPLLQFVGVLSVNLAILNILPFPALDGGRLVFLGLELVRGKKVRPEWEGWINMVGMFTLLGLMLAVTLNDIARVLGGWQTMWAKFWF